MDCLKRDKAKKVTQEVLDKLTFNINAHPQEGAVGSAAEPLFRRSPRNCLPNSVYRFITGSLRTGGTSRSSLLRRKEDLLPTTLNLETEL